MGEQGADDLSQALTELDTMIREHAKYDLSFGLQYSSVIDWVADITPRRNHPKARQYPLWQGQSTRPAEAIRRAIALAQANLADHEDGGDSFS